MILTYEKGYFKAFLDILEFADIYSESLKQYKTKKYAVLLNLIKYLAENKNKRDLFMRYGGNIKVIVNNTQVIDVKENK